MYVRKVRAPVMAALLALLVGRETSSVHVRKVRASVMAANGQRFQEGYDCCRSLMRPVLALSFVYMALLEGELQAKMYCRYCRALNNFAFEISHD